MNSGLRHCLKTGRTLSRKVLSYFYALDVKISCRGYTPPLRVAFRSRVTKHTVLKSNVHFNGLEVTGAGAVTIGSNFHCGTGCLIISQNHDYDNGRALPYDADRCIPHDVTIEDNVWLGSRVIVIGPVRIGEGAIIQAGSVVLKDIPKYGIAGGHPARAFKQRDIAHYERLKSEDRFC